MPQRSASQGPLKAMKIIAGAELEALAGWLEMAAICGTHFGCIRTGSGSVSTDATDFNPEACSKRRISGKRSLFQ